jgi:hypothetical protein
MHGLVLTAALDASCRHKGGCTVLESAFHIAWGIQTQSRRSLSVPTKRDWHRPDKIRMSCSGIYKSVSRGSALLWTRMPGGAGGARSKPTPIPINLLHSFGYIAIVDHGVVSKRRLESQEFSLMPSMSPGLEDIHT